VVEQHGFELHQSRQRLVTLEEQLPPRLQGLPSPRQCHKPGAYVGIDTCTPYQSQGSVELVMPGTVHNTAVAGCEPEYSALSKLQGVHHYKTKCILSLRILHNS
jgi:hypothetical protein